MQNKSESSAQSETKNKTEINVEQTPQLDNGVKPTKSNPYKNATIVWLTFMVLLCYGIYKDSTVSSGSGFKGLLSLLSVIGMAVVSIIYLIAMFIIMLAKSNSDKKNEDN